MQKLKDKLIVALDVDSLKEAERLVDVLYPDVKIFKVGSSLVIHCESLIQYIKKKGGCVFLDLKWYDIPNTVYYATSSSTASTVVSATNNSSDNIEKRYGEVTEPGVFMMTVHTQGSEEMLKKAVQGAEDKAQELNIKKPFIVGVTALTSESSRNTENTVLERANKAKAAGLDGVVCSAQEANMIREACGKDFIIVTPGIRPGGYASDDQVRVATPKEAVKAGADFIVVGRSIIKAENPKEAAVKILKDIE